MNAKAKRFDCFSSARIIRALYKAVNRKGRKTVLKIIFQRGYIFPFCVDVYDGNTKTIQGFNGGYYRDYGLKKVSDAVIKTIPACMY